MYRFICLCYSFAFYIALIEIIYVLYALDHYISIIVYLFSKHVYM